MQIYANERCHGVCGGETVVTGRGMRLKRAMGSGRTFSTHNALWCLFTHCDGLWVVRGKASRLLNIFSAKPLHRYPADDIQTFTGTLSVDI